MNNLRILPQNQHKSKKGGELQLKPKTPQTEQKPRQIEFLKIPSQTDTPNWTIPLTTLP